MKTKVMKCNCKHEGQDKLHGKGRRVHNLGVKDLVWRCTVCLKETKEN